MIECGAEGGQRLSQCVVSTCVARRRKDTGNVRMGQRGWTGEMDREKNISSPVFNLLTVLYHHCLRPNCHIEVRTMAMWRLVHENIAATTGKQFLSLIHLSFNP